jgi:prepilin-type processing-associated H-X9-DG protein
MQYTQDYDEKLPYAVMYASSTGGDFMSNYVSAWDVIQPYTKSLQIFVCPSNTATNQVSHKRAGLAIQTGEWYWPSYPPCDNYGDSYYPNTKMAFSHYPDPSMDNPYGSGNKNPVALSEFTNAAETFLTGDSNNRTDGLYFWGYGLSPKGFSGNANSPSPSSIHLDGGNWLYADGHVKWLKPENANQTVNGIAYYYWSVNKS